MSSLSSPNPPTNTSNVSGPSTSTAPSSTGNNANSAEPTPGQAEARAAVLASLTSAGATHQAHLAQQASILHAGSQAIAAQDKTLRQNAASLSKNETRAWQREMEKAAKALKEVGDVQNWAEMLERDLCVLEETARQVEGGERVESASGGSQWRESDARDAGAEGSWRG